MEVVKSKPAAPVQAPEAPKRTQATQAKQESNATQQAEANASKTAAYEQPKPTTNTRGEKLGQRLNAIA